ncbi:alpha-L-arabinofuranosidase C-terminal domain-containing protein [Nocardiopsis suaedae]|uniref:non-reducing end alpha-L-arabinofuranosidase n=1 Tax=Nocardiopsis suaedae TaxID=3018444 RepID=A0ABT4TKP6_9ACTN|nr:alpha-L-arabinofuranosidase C-terminal domain-containing protein [Nocardiopsis suaedae]MDA2805284.1 carbohydrate binding domain-containing protein [Nocardiopsis suaedae]
MTAAATGALLACALCVTAAAPASAATDYTIDVDTAATGPNIGDGMYGIFMEDINHAADGGLYAELVQNRSFEYSTADNADYTPMTSWEAVADGGADGNAEVVGDDGRLNERNRNYLRLALPADGGEYGVANTGYSTGIPVEEGAEYDFSVWAKAAGSGTTPLTVRLTDPQGAPLAAPLELEAGGREWAQYSGTLTADSSSTAGRLAVTGSGGGSLSLDMVSLFPRDTFKGRENGLRADIAEKIAGLDPGFVRFPGGCLVNTGSHEAYEAPDWPRERSFQWKDTVGPVEERAVNHNFWGYNQSYGLGYYEYFQFAEDLGAMPLPVVPALVTGCGENEATDDPELLERHVQDTLDLIEFANGPADSEWGGLRAEMGHPEPFGLTHVQVGNEENLPEEFFERFVEFRDAIEAEYPDITVVGNSGPASGGTVFERAWELNREHGVELVDEHYYNSPEWFLSNNERYDSYDREGPDVYLGEYASQGNRFSNALAEAAYMTGLERNADVVKMASYAPLLAAEWDAQWTPDMIWFDTTRSWGSANYEVQRLFARNTGDAVVPSTASGTPDASGPITGAVGLSTWNTSAEYDDVKVTSAGGETLLSDDFSGGADRWEHITDAGSWAVEDGAYVQTETAGENTMVMAGDPGWTDYDMEVTATKREGDEGFLIGFGVQGSQDYYWWNLGGWGNTRSAVEHASGGAKSTVVSDETTIEAGRAYDVRIEVRGRDVTLYLDGEEWNSFTAPAPEPFRQVVTHDEETGEYIVKVVNAQSEEARTSIDLGGAEVAPTAELTVLAADPDAENTAEDRPVAPETSTIEGVDSSFTHTFPQNSITFMRIGLGD